MLLMRKENKTKDAATTAAPAGIADEAAREPLEDGSGSGASSGT